MKKIISIVITILIVVSSLTISQFNSYATDKEALTVQQKAQNLLSNYNYKNWKRYNKVQDVIVENGEYQGLFLFDHKVIDFTALVELYDTDSFEKLNNAKYYYQMVLIDLLHNKSILEEKISNTQDLFDNNLINGEKIAKDILDIKLDDKRSKIGNKKSELNDKLKDICGVSDEIFNIIDNVDTVGDFIKSAIQLSSLEDVSDAMEEIIRDIGISAEKEGNLDLKFATDNVVNKINLSKSENMLDNAELYTNEFSEKLFYKFMDDIFEEILSDIDIMKIASIAYESGKLVGNIVASGDEQCSTYLYMKALYQIEKLLLSNMNIYESDISSDYTSNRLISSFELFNSIQTCGLDMAEKYVNIFHNKNIFFKISDECYNSYINAIETSRLYMGTIDFYSSDSVDKTNYGKLDICFVIDTTYSMNDDIDNVKENMNEIIESLSTKAEDFRVSLVDYRDFSERTGDSSDYPYDVKLRFTNNVDEIKKSINALDLGYGGDNPETVYSGIMAAINSEMVGNWRNDSTKVLIVMGDAGALDPEPYTNYTYSEVINSINNGFILKDDYDVIKNAVSASPVGANNTGIKAYTISIGGSEEVNNLFSNISKDTNGIYTNVLSASEVSENIINLIEKIEIENPFEIPTPFNVNVDFTKKSANKNVTINLGNNISINSLLDENGTALLSSLYPGVYQCVVNDDIYSMTIDDNGVATVVKNNPEIPPTNTSNTTNTTVIKPSTTVVEPTTIATFQTDVTTKISTNDTATNNSINNDNGVIKTGNVSIIAIIILLLASLSAGAFALYKRKIK